jgi:hypothetical protein
MDTIQRTKDILVDAEKALAALASEAAKGTQYEEASCLIDSAREVKNLAAKTLERLGHPLEKSSADFKNQTDGSQTSLTPGVRSAALRTKSQKSSYPRFLRQGDELVKIGWSPSEKTEYEHRSPRKVVLLLAAAIAKAGANGRRFAMDRVIPLQEPADGRRIPDYQVYLCLAWLRELSFVIQHGRQGYSLASKAPIEPLLETHWASLAVR